VSDEWTEQKISDELDAAISEALRRAGDHWGVLTHFVVIAGHQEPTGETSMVSYIPKMGQPFYVSMGLVKYQAAILEGIARDAPSTDEKDRGDKDHD
jgi:hypothetical protein